MIKFKSKLKTFEIPSSYADLKVKDLNYLIENSDNELLILEKLTGLNCIELSMLDLSLIPECLAFLQTEPLEVIEESDTIQIEGEFYTLPESLGQKTYAQKILSSAAIAKNNPLQILSVYLQPILEDKDFDSTRLKDTEYILNDLDVESVYSCIKYILNKLKAIIEKENEVLKSDITHEQKAAGIENFNVLGDFNTIDLIASKYSYTHEQVENLKYDLIFLILYKSNLTSKFEKAYSELMKTQNK
jgi:hypothetical protein